MLVACIPSVTMLLLALDDNCICFLLGCWSNELTFFKVIMHSKEVELGIVLVRTRNNGVLFVEIYQYTVVMYYGLVSSCMSIVVVVSPCDRHVLCMCLSVCF